MFRTNSRYAQKKKKETAIVSSLSSLMALGGALRITRPTIDSAQWWAFAAPTAILSFYLCSVPFISS